MCAFSEIIHQINSLLWNFPMLVLLLGTHIYFTFKLKFIQRLLPKGIKLSFSKQNSGGNGITPMLPFPPP